VLKHTCVVSVCFVPNARLAVAGVMEIAGEHAGAIVTVAVADFDGSATLVATIWMPCVEGAVAGAVKLAVSPLVESVPQLAGQALPVRLQFTVVSGSPDPLTLAVNCSVAPIVTDALVGESVTCTSLLSVTVPVALAVASAWLVAVIEMAVDDGSTRGAV
jgi:hypothetical protein